MNAVGYGTDWHLSLRPSREEWLEDMPAHLPVELAYAVDLDATADRKIGHIEGFRSISGFCLPKAKRSSSEMASVVRRK